MRVSLLRVDPQAFACCGLVQIRLHYPCYRKSQQQQNGSADDDGRTGLPVEMEGTGNATTERRRLEGQVFDFWLLAILLSKFKDLTPESPLSKFKDLTPESVLMRVREQLFLILETIVL